MKMELPKYHETFIPILEVLNSVEAIKSIELAAKVRDMYYSDLPEELLNKKTMSGANVLLDRILWGKSYLKMAKFVTYPKRGLVQITEKGKKIIKKGNLSLQDLQNDQDFINHRESVKIKKENEAGLDPPSAENTSQKDVTDSASSAMKGFDALFEEFSAAKGDVSIKITRQSDFAMMLTNIAGIKRIVVLADEESIVKNGLSCAREILIKKGTAVADAELNDSFLGSYEIEYIDGLPFSNWIPPKWWPQKPTAIFLGCPRPDLNEKIVRCLCKYAVLDDSQSRDRSDLPYDKIPDGSFFILGDNLARDFSKRILGITYYASGEILILKQPYTETVET